jgi:hypothetical protein
VIAALFVQKGGVYYGLPDVDPWSEERDARLYAGPWPVVAHPPCARWSRLSRLTEVLHGLRVGDDGGCFASALASVRRWGGVLEHPAYSRAWKAHGLPWPPPTGQWQCDHGGGWCAQVEQSWYGHRAPKPTWLYAVRAADLPLLPSGHGPATSTVTTSRRRAGGVELSSHRLRAATPPAFRDLLLSIARSALHEPAVPAMEREGT